MNKDEVLKRIKFLIENGYLQPTNKMPLADFVILSMQINRVIEYHYYDEDMPKLKKENDLIEKMRDDDYQNAGGNFEHLTDPEKRYW